MWTPTDFVSLKTPYYIHFEYIQFYWIKVILWDFLSLRYSQFANINLNFSVKLISLNRLIYFLPSNTKISTAWCKIFLQCSTSFLNLLFIILINSMVSFSKQFKKIVSVILSFCVSKEFYFSVGRKVSKRVCFHIQYWWKRRPFMHFSSRRGVLSLHFYSN